MTLPLDSPSMVRAGEELNADLVERYLRQALTGLKGPITVSQFPRGHSNLTYLISSPSHELVLRRPPFGTTVKSAHDMSREYRVLSGLAPHYPPAPKPIAFCDEESVLGAPFYVMERKRGAILRAEKPVDFGDSPDLIEARCRSFIQGLADLHGLDFRAMGLEHLYRGQGYVKRQTDGWGERYVGSKTDEIPEVDRVVEWLQERIPTDSDAVLIHNDYKFDNLILDPADPTRIVGVLDWEMATIGDPIADLGTSLAYWIEPGDGSNSVVQCFLTLERGAMTRSEVVQTYSEITGRDTRNILFYYVLALLKLAVILQQIYYRYAKGLTQDDRFAGLIGMVRHIARRAASAIESKTV